MSRNQPCCQTGPKWIRERLKALDPDRDVWPVDPLAPLTGQDWRALKAFFHLVDLYGCSDADGRASALMAMRYTVQAMQPETRHLAKAGIPHVLDWSHEAEIWGELGIAATYA